MRSILVLACCLLLSCTQFKIAKFYLYDACGGGTLHATHDAASDDHVNPSWDVTLTLSQGDTTLTLNGEGEYWGNVNFGAGSAPKQPGVWQAKLQNPYMTQQTELLVVAPAEVISLSPTHFCSEGDPDREIVIKGRELTPSTRVGESQTVQLQADGSLLVTLNAMKAGTYDVWVKNEPSCGDFTQPVYVLEPPAVASITAWREDEALVLRVDGEHIVPQTTVKLGDREAPRVRVGSGRSIEAVFPSVGVGSYPIIVSNADCVAAANAKLIASTDGNVSVAE